MAKTTKVKSSPEIVIAVEIAAALLAGVLDKERLKLFDKRLKVYRNLKSKKEKKHG